MKRRNYVVTSLSLSFVALLITGFLPDGEKKTISSIPPTPALNEKQVALGAMLFFETRLSGDNALSCASCHSPKKNYTDGLEMSIGYPTSLYFRNTPTILNTAFKSTLYWDGRIAGSDLPTLVRDHISEAHFYQADGRWSIERLRQIPEYEKRFKEAFNGEPSYGRILDALAAFVRSQNSEGAPIDDFLKGNTNAISNSAKKGYELFTGKANCVSCHNGPLLSDNNFYNTGVATNIKIFENPLRHITFRRFFKTMGVENYVNLREDLGYYSLTKNEKDKGKFRTASLREVTKTAPYMHNGMMKTLEEVIDFYNKGGGVHPNKTTGLKPLNLSSQEKKDLVEFLNTLSGRDVVVQAPVLPEYELMPFGKW